MEKGTFCAGVAGLAVSALLAGSANAAGGADWSAYLNGPAHTSYLPTATAVTAANVHSLGRAWSLRPTRTSGRQPAANLQSSPVLHNGVLYIGSGTGAFYAVDESTGVVKWRRQFPWDVGTTCGVSLGFVSTASVARDPKTGVAVVYVAAPDGYLYALKASNGQQLWRAVVGLPSTTKNDYFNWGSPTVANGKIYMGISSECDLPLVRGGVRAYDQATGDLLATRYLVPSGVVGASVWSSIAVDSDGAVYATTGNEKKKDRFGAVYSIMKLDGTTLSTLGRYQVPPSGLPENDDDFGASPTLFTATIGSVRTPMVGACNKNGVYYAVRRSDMALMWSRSLSISSSADPNGHPGFCGAAATWDGHHLYEGTNSTTIGGTLYAGSVRKLDPDTGATIWETGLPGHVLGSTSLNGSGVLAAPLFGFSGPLGVVLLDATTGAILRTINSGGSYYAQPTWGDRYLFVAAEEPWLGLQAWTPPLP